MHAYVGYRFSHFYPKKINIILYINVRRKKCGRELSIALASNLTQNRKISIENGINFIAIMSCYF
jgi:hypothetical protein